MQWTSEANQWGGYTGPLHVTRLHVRYSRKTFPQDLVFINTPNSENFQGRYIVRHPATGDLSCEAGKKYLAELRMRKKKELDELVALTDWSWSRYKWYLGDAGEPAEPVVDPVIDPVKKNPVLIGGTDGKSPQLTEPDPIKVDVSNLPVQPVAQNPAPAGDAPTVAGVDESTDAFIMRAKEQAHASTTIGGSNRWILFGIAGAMFGLGLLVRGRRRQRNA